MTEFLDAPFLGQATWLWLVFATVVVALLAFDLGVLHRNDREIGVAESLGLSAGYIGAGLLFGLWLWFQLGAERGIEYFTGFMIEKSLSMDNVFVIAMIFGFFAIPRQYQHRVLFWGVMGVIVLRAIMIGLGAALVTQFSWVLYLFGAFLVLTGVKMLWLAQHHPDLENNLVLVEFADLVFAVDSVPAIFAITTDPFIVYTSNIFAILGLRALYFALAAMIHRFAYLKYALALVLVFIGGKIFLVNLTGKIPPLISLGVTLALIAGGVAVSLWKTRPGAAVHTTPRQAA
jgi:tellurite resistance protein TerC